MTVLVGVLARDGVVIAADSAVTFGHGGAFTVSDRMPKISIVADKFIIAGTGQVGLGQRLLGIVKREYDGSRLANSGQENAVALAKAAHVDFGSTGAPRGQFGALVASYAKGTPWLCEFQASDFQPEMKGEHCWYVSMGSGQALADPYLALLRKTFWENGQPNVEDALFGAFWAIKHAIDVAPGYVAHPISIAVIKKWDGANFAPKMLDEHEHQEQLATVEEANQLFRDFRKRMQPKLGDIPRPDKP